MEDNKIIRCQNSFHCSRCMQPEGKSNFFIFIEHTKHCASLRCDIPCIAQKREVQPIMSTSLVQEIINKLDNCQYNVVLYGLGSSDYPYEKLNIPKKNSFQTTINNSYSLYSKQKPANLLLFARAYSLKDINEIISCGNYDGVKTVICSHVNNSEYVQMALECENNEISFIFDYDHISNNVSKLNEILIEIGECKNVSYRGNCNGTKPLVIMNWSHSFVTYREEYHYFETTKTINTNLFLKQIDQEKGEHND